MNAETSRPKFPYLNKLLFGHRRAIKYKNLILKRVKVIQYVCLYTQIVS
jgi:hypothetical protein